MKIPAQIATVIVAFMFLAVDAYGGPREDFQQAIEQLQKTPGDFTLREKLIKFAQDIKPALTVPEEARRHFVMAVTMQKEAKSPKAYEAAISEYDQALLIAPWWGDAYYNHSVADEAAEHFDAARNALKLYLATHPNEADARQAQDHIYALDAKMAMAAKSAQVTAEASAATKNDHLIVPGSHMGQVHLDMSTRELYQAMGQPKNSATIRDGTWYTFEQLSAMTDLSSGKVSFISTTSPLYTLKDGLSVGSSLLELRSTMANPVWWSDTMPGSTEYCYQDGLFVGTREGKVSIIRVQSSGCGNWVGHYQCYRYEDGRAHIGKCMHD